MSDNAWSLSCNFFLLQSDRNAVTNHPATLLFPLLLIMAVWASVYVLTHYPLHHHHHVAEVVVVVVVVVSYYSLL